MGGVAPAGVKWVEGVVIYECGIQAKWCRGGQGCGEVGEGGEVWLWVVG